MKGPIPGEVNNYINIYDSKVSTYKQTEEEHQPFPTFFPEEEDIEDDLYADNMHRFSMPSIKYE